MPQYNLQHVLYAHPAALQPQQSAILKIHSSSDGLGIRFYLQTVPFGIIILLGIGYVISRFSSKAVLNLTSDFIKDEASEDNEDVPQPKIGRPSILWCFALTIISVIAISVQLNVLLRPNASFPYQFDTVLSLISWSLLFLAIILSRPRYCTPWLLLFYCTSLVAELSTIPGWTRLTDTYALDHSAIIVLNSLSMVVLLSMPFKPTSPISGPIGTVGSIPSDADRSPEDSLRLWQFFSASWVWPLLMIGKKRQLEKEDVWKLSYAFQNGRIIAAFREIKGSTLLRRLLRANSLDCCILVATALTGLIADLASPLLLQQLLLAIESPLDRTREAFMFALLIFVRGIVSAQIASFQMWFGRRCYERTRGELIMTVYEKAVSRKIITIQDPSKVTASNSSAENGVADHTEQIGNGKVHNEVHDAQSPGLVKRLLAKVKKLNTFISAHSETANQSIKHASTGQILNLVRTDANDVAKRFTDITRLVKVPIGIIFSIWLIWHLLGWSCLLAIAVIVVAQAINALLARLQMGWQRYRKKATDERVQMNSQFIQVIRHLRFYGWEEQWLAKVMASRRHELNVRIVSMIISVSMYIMTVCSSSFIPVAAFFSYTAFAGKELRIDIIFPAIQLFRNLQSWLREGPTLITSFLNASVSMGRIEDFLQEPENEKCQLSEEVTDIEHLTALRFVECNFVWPGTDNLAVENANLVINPGLTLVHGQVGSGKTALLESILGEMDLVSGTKDVPNEMIAYCSQTPWLQSISIRDNILFFSPYDEERYQRVLESCALVPDLAEFKDGDMSEIGENGIGLSGGQRARVALARALYSKARVLLLDDPLSALDHQTAEGIVRDCFTSDLVKDRIVVLVTHRTGLVHQVARQFIEVSNSKLTVTTANPFLKDHKPDDETQVNSKVIAAVPEKKQATTESSERFIDDEKRQEGGIKAKVWLTFVKAGKWWWILLFTMMALTRVASIAQTWVFKSWGEAYQKNSTKTAVFYPTYFSHQQRDNLLPSVSGDVESLVSLDPIDYLPSPKDDLRPWLILLLIVSLAQALCLTLYACSQLTAVYATSKVLFEQAIQTVTGASFRFYDTTPVGRIMNRLTSDIQILDSALTYFGHTIFFFSLFVSSIIVIASVSPIFLLFSAALMGVFVLIFRQFLPASRSLKRLENVSLSPIYTIFDELLQNQGLTTVRAFHAQSSFHNRFVAKLDSYQGFGHFYNAAQIWLMFRYENLSSFSTFLLTLIALLTNLSPGLTAFMLINASNFIAATHTLCLQLADLQTEFISVERIVELLETEQEPKGTLHPPASWPQYGGDITFDKVTVRYAPHLDPSLSDITLHIPGGSTTAVIGRTGSGKSTLASTLLNIVRVESGEISVDNVSLTNIDVHTLRRRITFVPQDPVLFLGTIRQNLDPVDEFNDAECQAVLDRVCAEAASQTWKLDTHVDSGGKNLSQGQRQLIGITRAVLRRSPVVILDEATASIDLETSIKLQRILREELKEATIVVVAHRPEAVEGVDYVVVLDKGRVLRQGKMDGDIKAISQQVE